MMGPRQEAQPALFYEFSLEDHIPTDYLLRSIDRFVYLSSIRAHLAEFYSYTGRPSVDPELLIHCPVGHSSVKAKFDLHPERLITDTAYGTGPMLGWLVDRRIAPHISVFDKSNRIDGTWRSRADFEWDAENDQYICPEGHKLKQFRRNYSDPNRGPTGQGRTKYHALKLTCQACCPSKQQCCPKADFRSIIREEHEATRQVARDIAKTKHTPSRCYGVISRSLLAGFLDSQIPELTLVWQQLLDTNWAATNFGDERVELVKP